MTCFVIVHGSFEGGWSFSRLARILRRVGHEVWTPTLTGSGERFHLLTREISLATHVQDVSSLLEYEDLRDVILVGHSYGGAVVTAVADRVPERIARVVYMDAMAPVHGQTASGSLSSGTDAVLQDMVSGENWLLPPLPLPAVGITNAEDVAFMEARRHPHPMRTLLEPLALTGRIDALPRAYVAFTEHGGLRALLGSDPLAPYLERARREGWPVQELDLPHDGMFTHPERVAAALLAYAG